MALSGLAREIGRVSYGLLWVYAIGAVLVWPVGRFSGLISEPRLQYLAWIGWGAVVVGFVTIMLDGSARKAIIASNEGFQAGTAIPWPPRVRPKFLDIFSPRMGGVGMGVLRLLGLLEFIVAVVLTPAHGPMPSTTQIAFCSVAVATILAMRALAGPVFATSPPISTPPDA